MTWPDLVSEMNLALLDSFGESTVYTTASGQAYPVTGVFSAPYERVDAGEAGVSSSMPCVFYREADLPNDAEAYDPTITIRGTAYRVFERKPDGDGGLKLELQER